MQTRNKYTQEEIKILNDALKIYNELKCKKRLSPTIANRFYNTLYNNLNCRHSIGSISNMLAKISLCTSRQAIKEVVMTTTHAVDIEDEDVFIPNGFGKVCRLAKEVEKAVEMFYKSMKEFKEEYDSNMELLRNMAELRKAAEKVGRKIIKGE